MKHFFTVYLIFFVLVVENLSAQFQPIYENNLRILYVSPNGNDAATGDVNNPYKTIQKAIGTALYFKKQGTGSKVIIAPGTYRENHNINYTLQVNTPLANSTAAPLILEGAGWDYRNSKNTKDVIISGSEDYAGNWTKNADGTWSKDWKYDFGVPKKTQPFGVSDAFLRRELVHVNGQMFYQLNPPNYQNQNGTVGTQSEAEGGSTFNTNGGRLTESEGAFWVEDAIIKDGKIEKMGKITIKLPKDFATDFDLNDKENLVEVTTKKGILQTWLGSVSPTPTNIVIRNITFQHGGSQSYFQHQNNLLIEDCRFINNKHIGLSVNPGKNVMVRRCEFSNNGEGGATFNAVSDAEIVDCRFNNNARQAEIVGYQSWSVCGVKFYSTKGDNKNIIMRRCVASNNRGTGFWWDTGNILCQMIDCKGAYNSLSGAFIENNNSPENNFENIEKANRENTGIPTLGSNYTVKAYKSVFTHNGPVEETKAYRNVKGRGIFFSENENSIVENCLIFDNDIQISTYDNRRGENKNFTFKNNLIAVSNENQRLYAVGSPWDSREIFPVTGQNNTVALNIKGGWYGMYDGMNNSTNDNLYFHPNQKAFYSRQQRIGTDKWKANPDLAKPTLNLEEWRTEHQNNNNNSNKNKAVDSRSILKNTVYDNQKPLLVFEYDSVQTEIGSYKNRYFTVSRVTDQKLNLPFGFSYKIILDSKSPEYQDGKNVVAGQLNIPSWNTSVNIKIDLTQFKGLEKNDKVRIEIDSIADAYYIIGASKTIAMADIENERKKNNFDKNTDENTVIQVIPNNDFEIKVRINEAVKKVKLQNADGLDIPLTDAVLNENQYTFKPMLALVKGKYELKIKTEKSNLKYMVESK
jgi:Right handed beta helix region/Protein of unknown function (DUF1565)